ncbi:MAG: response regulator [Sulfuricella sp.]|nr:response regulator [Sulfuricella sp.]
MNRLIRILEKRRLATKLLLGFAAMLLLSLALGVHSILNQRALNVGIQQLYENELLGVSGIEEARIHFARMGRALRQAILAPNEGERNAALKQLTDAESAVRKEIEASRSRIFLEENKKNLVRFEARFATYTRNVEQSLALLRKNDFRPEAAIAYVSTAEFQRTGQETDDALEDIVRLKQESTREAAQHAQAFAEEGTRMTAILLGSGTLLVVVFGALIGLSIRRPTEHIREAVKQLAAGQLDVTVPYADHPNEIGDLARAVAVLQNEARQMDAQRWIKTHQAALSAELQEAASFADLARKLLSGLAPLLKIGHGVFYIYEEEPRRLRLLGSYAYRERKQLNQYFALGEGLVGQCALEMTPIVISEPPPDYVHIGSSLGAATPRTIAVLPVIRNDKLLAVIELATFEVFDANQQALLDGLMPLLAMSLEILERNVRTRQLLEETQRQAESMEKQASQLEEQAVELEAQQGELKATEAWYRGIIESAPDGMLVIDRHGTIILANPQIETMFGHGIGELPGNPIEILVPPAIREEHVGWRDAFIADSKTGRANRELRGVRPDGSEFPAEVGLSKLPDVGGRGLCVCASVRDITERQQAAQHLSALEERSRMILSSVSDGIVGLDLDGRMTFTNPAAPAMLGFNEAEMLGERIHSLVHHHYPDGREFPREECRMYRTTIDGQARTVDDEVLWRKDGSPFPVEYSTTPVHKDGALVGTVVTFRDITERKQAQAEVLRAKEIAEEATKTKSDFLANMSHEIRTPMNAIIGMSHLALQTQLDKRQRNYIEKVNRAAANLLGIINDILDFSKIEAGKMSMERIDFRLEDVMDNLANLVGMKAEDKGLELLFNAAPDVPTALVGDPLRLGQILINLGNNAVKFTDAGEIVVGVEKAADHPDGVDLHFWVKDSGIGMTPEQCSKMFQSFSQADASTTRKYGGTGLGLAISKNLVEKMDGRIWVESEAGKGSTFHFHARFDVQAEPMARRVFRAEELLGVRVLVVDDNASAREILSGMARNFGLEVDVAGDGQQALAMIGEAERKELPYDLVLMDWKMPVMDGVETMLRLQEEQLARVPAVIMVTAYGREEALGSAEQRGVELKTVLTKPVTSSTLLEAIGEMLGKGLVADDRVHDKVDRGATAMDSLKGARVLLVEDNDMNQELASELLGQAGMEVVIANHGQEALDILARDARFDGVLMDCQMPVMDGYTATREIRNNPAFKNLPIIAMTANAMAGDKEKVMEAGMNDHIAKPLDVEEMFATLAKWIKPAGTAPASSAPAPAAAQGGLPTLPGIDIKAGLATTMNNEKLYTRLLVKFRDGQSNFAALFRAAQADADPTAAARAAHTLKGTAGNIGAKGVQAAAGELESACNQGVPTERIDELLNHVLAELAPLIAGLAQVEGAEPLAVEAPGTTSVDRARLTGLQEKLKALLADSDTEASDVLDELRELAKGTPLAASLKKVADAIAAYDFDAALEALG